MTSFPTIQFTFISSLGREDNATTIWGFTKPTMLNLILVRIGKASVLSTMFKSVRFVPSQLNLGNKGLGNEGEKIKKYF